MEATTPNGTKYNLRQREKRNLSSSFLSSGSESPPPLDHNQSRTRNNSSTKKKPYAVPQQLRGRPSIHRPTASDLPPHFSEGPQTIISGNIPPPQPSGHVRSHPVASSSERNRPVSGSPSQSPLPQAPGNARSQPTHPATGQTQDVVLAHNPPPQDIDSDVHQQQVPASDPTLTADGKSQSSTPEVDATLAKSLVECSASSLDVNAPESLVGRSLISAETNSAGSSSSQGSAKFLDAASFYGSSSSSNRPPSPRMGTKLCQRSPLFPPPIHSIASTVSSTAASAIKPAVSMATSALSTAKLAVGATRRTISRPTIAAGQNPVPKAASAPIESTPLPVSSLLFGTDASPVAAARLQGGEFSDEEDAPEETQLKRRSQNQQRAGGGDGPDASARKPSNSGGERMNNSAEGLIALLIVFALLGVIGSLSRHFFGEKEMESASLDSTAMEEPIEPAVEFSEALLETRVRDILRESVERDIADLRGSIEKAQKERSDRAGDARSNEKRLFDSLRSLEGSVEKMAAQQRAFVNEMQNHKMELNRLSGANLDHERAVKDIRDSASKTDDAVEAIEEKFRSIEREVKTSGMKQVTELQALKALIRVSSSREPPVVNETQLIEKMQGLQEQMRVAVSVTLMDFVRGELDRINAGVKDEFQRREGELSKNVDELKHYLRTLVSEEVAILKSVKTESPRIDMNTVKDLVQEILGEKEKEGLDAKVDYALESQGGSVIDEASSETYVSSPAALTLFGVPLWYRVNGPRTIIGADIHPGQCWPMSGSSGHALIKLSHNVLITGFSLEHISKRASPINSISSAPKDFRVDVLLAESGVVSLGPFKYDENATNTNQHFELEARQRLRSDYVRLRVDSNYGHSEYTCIYRFRVHGMYG